GASVNVVPARVDSGQHEHLVSERGQWFQDRRELEVATFTLRRPVLHGHAVRHVEGKKAMRSCCRSPGRRRKRREHRVEERQRQRGSQPAENRASGQRFSGQEDHWSSPRIRNGGLFTMPAIKADQRKLLAGGLERTLG